MIFLSTLAFRRAIQQLLKVKRGEYASVNEDIANAFIGKTPEEIYIMPDMIRQYGAIKEIKLRVEDSSSNRSKKDGYRLIYLISEKKSFICLLYVYPKRGSLGQITITKNDVNIFFNDFIKEYESKSLVCHTGLGLTLNRKHLCKEERCEHEQLACLEVEET